MTIAIADSWADRSNSATLDVPVSDVEIGDMIVVVAFAAGGGTPDAPSDDAGNTYTVREETTPDGTFTTSVGIADCVCDEVPTQISVSNSAGGSNDVAAVVLRVTHNGSGWFHSDTANALNVTADDPTTGGAIDVDTGANWMQDEYINGGSALLLAALTHDGADTTFAPAGGWTEIAEDEDASGGIPYSVVYRVDTARDETATHQWTTGASRDYATLTAGYSENVFDIEISLVTVTPSPAGTGLTIEVDDPDLFPDPSEGSYHILVASNPDNIDAAGELVIPPNLLNSEFLRVLSRTGDEFEIERGQHGSLAQIIEVGWLVFRDHMHAGEPLGLLAQIQSFYFGYVFMRIDERLDSGGH